GLTTEITNISEYGISTEKSLRFRGSGFYVERDIVGHIYVQTYDPCLHARFLQPRSRSASFQFQSTSIRLPNRRRVCRSTCCTRSATDDSSSSTSAPRTAVKSSSERRPLRATSSRRISMSFFLLKSSRPSRKRRP